MSYTAHTCVSLCCAVHMHMKCDPRKERNEPTMRASEPAIGIHRKFIWETHTHQLHRMAYMLSHWGCNINNSSSKQRKLITIVQKHSTAHIKYIMFTMFFLYFASARYIHCSLLLSVSQPNESSNKTWTIIAAQRQQQANHQMWVVTRENDGKSHIFEWFVSKVTIIILNMCVWLMFFLPIFFFFLLIWRRWVGWGEKVTGSASERERESLVLRIIISAFEIR